MAEAAAGMALLEESTDLVEVTSPGSGIGWLDPRISFSVDFVEKGLDFTGEPTSADFRDGGSTDFEFYAKERKGKRDTEGPDYSAEFEFCMSSSGGEPATNPYGMLPADELFYKWKLPPLQLPSRLDMLEYIAAVEGFEFAKDVRDLRLSAQLNSHSESSDCSAYATPTVGQSPGSSGHLSPPAVDSDTRSALPSSAGSRLASPCGDDVLFIPPSDPTGYLSSPDSPPARLRSCLPSPHVKWKGFFGSFMKMRARDAAKEQVFNGGQLEKTESKRLSFSRRLSFSLRRATDSRDVPVTQQTASTGDPSGSESTLVDADDSASRWSEPCSTDCRTSTSLEGGAHYEETSGSASGVRTADPASSSGSSCTSYAVGSAALALDELLPLHDGNGEVATRDTPRAQASGRRGKYPRWIILGCGLRSTPRFKGSSGMRISGRGSSGNGSPGRLAVKVEDVEHSDARITLKDLEFANDEANRRSKMQEQLSLLNQQTTLGYASPEKPGSYSASVRVMPVLNVQLCNLAPAFRAAKSSSRGRFPVVRHFFCLRTGKSAESSPAQEHVRLEGNGS